MTDITNIPLNKLAAWDGNVRKVQNRGFIAELAASIKAHGLQQNLIVRKDGRKFAVVAGGQRLKALQQLAASGDIEAGHLVPCKVIDGESDATELSLAENVVRDNMHPADQFEAFCALIDKGAPVADVAARFGVSETVVTQRLKLARVSPVILHAYRDESLNLEQVMAFAISDDHAAQERVLDNLRTHDRDPRAIRDALTEGDVAATDRRVKFVTLKAYEKAGGAVRRDLFSADDDGVFLLDTALLDKLVIDKLEKAAKAVRNEGWKWVETHPDFGYETRSRFHRRHPELFPLPPEEAAELEKLEQEYEALLDQWRDADDDAERPERLDALEERIEKLNDREDFWPPETLSIAGAVVTIGYDAKATVERGLIRPEDMPRKTGKQKSSGPDETGHAGNGGGQSAAISAALIESLTAHRSAALAGSLVDTPDMGLAVVVYAMVLDTFGHHHDTALKVSAAAQSLHRVEGSKAFRRLEEARENWGQRIPGTPGDIWQWCLEQDQAVLLDLLTFCAACAINAVRMKSDRPDSPRLVHAGQLAAALCLDMATWFAPTAENYFSRISKPQILEALSEAKGTPPAPAWEKLKKPELTALAERETSGTGWLPEMLR